MKSSWSRTVAPAVSFADVMSEQLANSIVEDDIIKDALESSVHMKESSFEESDEALAKKMQDTSVSEADTSSDEALARMLQAQWDKEYNDNISLEENRVNKYSKVKVSLDNYRAAVPAVDNNSMSDDSWYSDEDDYQEPYDSRQKSGGSGKTIVTKHDKEVCGRRNIGRMEASFPANFLSGDIVGMDLKINNKTYNSLKQHAFNEERRGQRLHETKDHYTAEHVFDEKTRLLLYKLVNNGLLTSINGIISVGKESIVVHADGGDSTLLKTSKSLKNDRVNGDLIPGECAIKIYKTTLNEFRTRDRYIKDDYRFKDRFKKLNPRKIIHMWAEKEMSNLLRIKEAGIPCPEVVLLKKHVLVMSFIGTDQRHAPKLKEAMLNSSLKKEAYSQVVNIMKKMFNECRLVHADLSEYNLLWKNNQVWVIDVSQAVEPNHPHGLEFLYRDCQNICRFFRSWGVMDVLDAMSLFNDVSGLDLPTVDEGVFMSDIERIQNMAEEHAHQSSNKTKQLFE